MSTNIKHIIISGIQGSGKGTQSKKIINNYPEYVYIGSGDICRWHLKHKTIFAQKLAQINDGRLVDDDFMIYMVERRLKIHDPAYGFLLDGFPRSQKQAEHLFRNYMIHAAIHLDLSDDAAVKRILKRSRESEVKRFDDEDETALKERLKSYHTHTEPLLEFYQKHCDVHRISADDTIANVYQKIEQVLKG